MNSKQRERPRRLGCLHPSFRYDRNEKGRIVAYICEECGYKFRALVINPLLQTRTTTRNSVGSKARDGKQPDRHERFTAT